MSSPSPAGSESVLAAINRAFFRGDLKPAEMRVAFYCWEHGYVVPCYLTARGKQTLASQLGVHEEWLRQCFVRLHRQGIMRRERDVDGFWCYALNPDYRAPEEMP